MTDRIAGIAARTGAVAVGVWLMAAPAVLGYAGAAETNDRIVGPLAGAAAFIAAWAITRPLRWLTVPLGAWLLAAAFLLDYPTAGLVSAAASGALLIVTAPVAGADPPRFAGGWRSLLPRRAIGD